MTTIPGTESAPTSRDMGRRWLAAWDDVGFAMTGLLMAAPQLTIASLAFAGVVAIPAVGVGILLLFPSLWAALGLAALERDRLASVDAPVRAPGNAPPLLSRAMLTSGVAWRAVAYAALQGLWACVAGSFVAAVLVMGVVGLVAGVRVPESMGFGDWAGPVVRVVALAFVVLTPFIASGTRSVTAHLAQWLIGRDSDYEIRELSARVETLTTTRTETIDSVEAERRRIERDLHDGPQQRLVAIAMDLGMARSSLDADPDRVREILDRAHADSKAAITEMRQVARGITPPILTDRGLDAALTALAGRAPVPVSVDVRLDPGPKGRLNPTTEAIAYFSVSEALTNVAKHASATRAEVLVEPVADWLQVTITDDGIGGAEARVPEPGATSGTGLNGLRQRVAAVDGAMRIDSPAGGPTSVRILLPIREASQ